MRTVLRRRLEFVSAAIGRSGETPGIERFFRLGAKEDEFEDAGATKEEPTPFRG
jgi:hypothetical protein